MSTTAIDAYLIWCENNPCPLCDGQGTYWGDTCTCCGGDGIDPTAEYDGPNPLSDPQKVSEP